MTPDSIMPSIPPDIEAKAAREFERFSITQTGHLVEWNKASIYLKNQWRIKALLQALNANQWRRK